MALRYYANAPATTLAASCTNVATTASVASVTGFPIQYPFTLIFDRGTASEEAVSVTNASGTTLTIARAIDGTTAFSHSIGATVEHGITAQDIREPNSHINSSSGVHGVAGSLVGTTDAQTVTNKDLTSGTNTFPSTLATDAEVTSAVSTHAALTATHGATGAVVGTTNTQTLTNKTLTTPKIAQVTDTDGDPALGLLANAGTAVNYVEVRNAATTVAPGVAAVGTDGNIDLNLISKGTGKVKANAIEVLTLTDTQTLTNKTLSTGTKVGGATTDISDAWSSYASTWSAPTTNPAIGNGSIVAKYMQIGKTVFFYVVITMGTTTTYGSGQWRVTPPVTPSSAVRWPAHAEYFDVSIPGLVSGRATFNSISSTFDLMVPGVTAGGADRAMLNGTPSAPAAGDIVTVSGTYEAA